MTDQHFINRLMDEIDHLPDSPIEAITYGPHMVAVESRKTGLATWAWTDHPVPLERLPDPGKTYSGKTLARLIADDSPLHASLGLAALNSLLPELPRQHLTTLNAADLILDLGTGERVAVIGHFPFVEKMQGKFKELMVFEKKTPGRRSLRTANTGKTAGCRYRRRHGNLDRQ